MTQNDWNKRSFAVGVQSFEWIRERQGTLHRQDALHLEDGIEQCHLFLPEPSALLTTPVPS